MGNGKIHKIFSILEFAISKKYTYSVGKTNDSIIADDGSVFHMKDASVTQGRPQKISDSVTSTLSTGSVLELGFVHSTLYGTTSNIGLLLAFATTLSHNMRVTGTEIRDITKCINMDRLLDEFKSEAKDSTYLHKLVNQLTYILSVTKSHSKKGLATVADIEFSDLYLINATNKIDIMDISPFEGLTITVDKNSLTVHIVSHGEDYLLMDLGIINDSSRITMNVWNLYHNSDHDVGRAIKRELDKIGLLDIYLQHP